MSRWAYDSKISMGAEMDGFEHQGHGGAPALILTPTSQNEADRAVANIQGPLPFTAGHAHASGGDAHRQIAPVEGEDVRPTDIRPPDIQLDSEAPINSLPIPLLVNEVQSEDTRAVTTAVWQPQALPIQRPTASTDEIEQVQQETMDEPPSHPAVVILGQSIATNAPASSPHHDQEPQTLVPEPEPQTPVINDDTRDQPTHAVGEPHRAFDIDYDHDDVEGHRILRLKPTVEQWDDFPGVLAFARSLGAEGDGCFKVIIPDELQDALPDKPAQSLPANAYKVKLIRRTAFWQVSTTPSEGVFASSPPDSTDFSYSVDAALKNLKHLFRKNQNKRLRNIRYRVDVPAWTKTQRRLAGVAERSPIYPLKGDKLDKTKAIIPGIHTPYVYESASPFGATFQIHAEDFRLASLNHLYKGRKIWIVVPATDVDVAEKALGRGSGCSQFMRHRAEFFFPDKLDKLGIPYRLVDQRPGETIVILPDAYHEGFSCGYTIAEAKNYADPTWTTDSYQPCEASCRLATAIPAAFMRPLEEGEQRLDLCAAYGEGPYVPVAASMKRGYEEVDGGGHIPDETGGQKRERIDVYE